MCCFRVLIQGSNKKTIESVLMIIHRQTTPPYFLKTVIALGYFFAHFYDHLGS